MKKSTIIVNKLCVYVNGNEDVSKLGFLIYDKELDVSSIDKDVLLNIIAQELPNGGKVIIEGDDMMDFIRYPDEIDNIIYNGYEIKKVTIIKPLLYGNKKLLKKIKELGYENNLVDSDGTFSITEYSTRFEPNEHGPKNVNIFDGVYNVFKNNKLILKQIRLVL